METETIQTMIGNEHVLTNLVANWKVLYK